VGTRKGERDTHTETEREGVCVSADVWLPEVVFRFVTCVCEREKT